MVKVKGPTTRDFPPPTSAPSEAPAGPKPPSKSPEAVLTSPQATSAAAISQAESDEMQREWRRLRDLPHKQILRGAANLFSGVFFPSNLLDVNDPRNDPKYMCLLAAVLGLDDLNDYFYTGSEGEGEDTGSGDEAASESSDDAALAQKKEGKGVRKRNRQKNDDDK